MTGKIQKFSSLSKILGISFQNNNLIQQAFVHRSFLNETDEVPTSNERLEFLGDSILSFLVSDYLYTHYPNFPEGELTNIRSSMVKTTTLAEISSELSLGQYLMLSKGEEEGGGRQNTSILADTFEALLGAVYLDQGLAKAKSILEKFLFPRLQNIISQKTYKDAKSIFQEIVQEKMKISPVYKVLKESGPDHAKNFKVGVFVNNILHGEGCGKSKQEAEMNAAKTALEKWKK